MRTIGTEALRPYPILDSSKITNSLVAIRFGEVSGVLNATLDFHEIGLGVVGFRGRQAQTGTISFEFNLVVNDNLRASDIAEQVRDADLEACLILVSPETRSTVASPLVPLAVGANRVELEVDARYIGQKFFIRTVILSREKFQDDLPSLNNYVLYEDRLTFSSGGQKDSLNVRQVPFERAGFEKDFWKVIVDLPESFEELESYSISRAVAVEVNSNVIGPNEMTSSLTVFMLSDIASEILDKLVERCVDDKYFSQLQQLLKRKMRGVPYFREKSLLYFIHLVVSEVFIVELGPNRELSRASFVESWERNRQSHLRIWRSRWAHALKVSRPE